MAAFTAVPLDEETWPQFSELVERNNGVYGGCWCTAYHPRAERDGPTNEASKLSLVARDRAHASLAIDTAGLAQGWAQYGPPDELAEFKHKRAYDQEPPPVPDWRIACIFVDKGHRRSGVARAAMQGALEQISRCGGGLVEAISEYTAGREAQPRLLFSATAELMEELGFSKVRQVGKHAWLLSRTVEPR